MASKTCELCLKNIESPSIDKTSGDFKVITNHLWKYLFHKNVREEIILDDKDHSHPSLKFIFTTGEDGEGETSKVIGNGDDSVEFCSKCKIHLEKLNNLHEQLEAAKKQVRVQVRKMNNIRLLSRLKNNEEIEDICMESLWKKGHAPGMSLTGSAVGKENLSQALIYLFSLCNGMGSQSASVLFPGNPSSSREAARTDVPIRDVTAPSPSPLILQENPKVEFTIPPDEMLQFEEEDIFVPVVKVEEIEADPGPSESEALYSTPNVIMESQELGMEIPHDTDYDYSANNMTFSFTPGPETVSEQGDDPLRIYNADFKIPVGPSQRPKKKKTSKSGSSPCPEIEEMKTDPGPSGASCSTMGSQKGDQKSGLSQRSRKKLKRKTSSKYSPHKMVPCPDCGKLISNQGMCVHRRVHTGVKPFKCRLCEMAFTQWSSLSRHSNIHEGEMTFECEVCGVSFKTSRLLTIHGKRRHKNN